MKKIHEILPGRQHLLNLLFLDKELVNEIADIVENGKVNDISKVVVKLALGFEASPDFLHEPAGH